MKRRTLKFIACAAIMALTLSVTACGKDDAAETAGTTAAEDVAEPETEEDTDAEADVVDDTETEAPEEDDADVEAEADADAEDDADADASGDYSTLEDYYNDPAVQNALKSAFAALADEGMSADCDVKGNEFTVIIKIEDSSMIVDGLAEALDAALDTQEDTFKAQVKQFDDVIGQDGACTVVMRYTDPDDNILAEKAFTAN